MKPTSKQGEEHIKPFKASHKQKILWALAALKVGANHEILADKAELRPDQVWKRLSECERDGDIFDTGLTHPLKSGVPGIVWQLKIKKPEGEIKQIELF